MTEAQWKWYVYELIDPRTNKVFYVGKGSGNRINEHEREAKKGIHSRKTALINELHKLGLKVKKQKVAYFYDEQASYDHETDVIAGYGLETLTNVLPGGQIAWDRRVLERRTRQEQIQPLVEWLNENKGPKTERIFECFAEWFRSGAHENGKTIKLANTTGMCTTHVKMTEIIYNSMIPTLWRALIRCNQSMEQFALRMKPYGVEIKHG